MTPPAPSAPLLRFRRYFEPYLKREGLFLLVLAVTVGILSGLAAVGFRTLIGLFHRLFFDGGVEILGFMDRYYVILIPAAGAALLSELISKVTIYTMKLARKGISLDMKWDVDILDTIPVEAAMRRDFAHTSPDTSVREIAQQLAATRARMILVTETGGQLMGVVTPSIVEGAILSAHDSDQTARDILISNPLTCLPDQSLHEALKKFASGGLGNLLVVDRFNRKKILGILSETDVLSTYARITSRPEAVRHFKLSGDVPSHATRVVDIRVEAGSGLDGLELRHVSLPQGSIVVSIHRANQILIPHGTTKFQAGDGVSILFTREDEPQLKDQLRDLGIGV